MYIIKFASIQDQDVIIKGGYPYNYILEQLIAGKQLVVISTYSDTIKVPLLGDDHGRPILNSYEVNLTDTPIMK